MTLPVLTAVTFLAYFKEAQAGCDRSIMPTSSPGGCNDLSENKVDSVKDNNVSKNSGYANTSIVEDLESPTHSNYMENMQKDSQLHPLIPSSAFLNTLLSVICLLLNLIIITFYWFNSPSFSSILYLRNAIADSISAAGFLLQVPLVIRVLDEDIPPSLSLITYWITTVSVRMSVFMNCVLGVVRCINILNPFYQVKEKWVSVSVCSYFLIWSTITSLDLGMYATKIGLDNKVYLIKSLVLKATPGFSLSILTKSKEELSSGTTLSPAELIMYQFFLPLAPPAGLSFILMIIQVHHLTNRRVRAISDQPFSRNTVYNNDETSEEQCRRKRPNTNNQKAAGTILILTTTYVLTSTLSVVMWLVVYRTHLHRHDKIKILSWLELGVTYFSSSTLHLLCSVVTALTLLLRSAKMRDFLKDACKKTCAFVSRSIFG